MIARSDKSTLASFGLRTRFMEEVNTTGKPASKSGEGKRTECSKKLLRAHRFVIRQHLSTEVIQLARGVDP